VALVWVRGINGTAQSEPMEWGCGGRISTIDIRDGIGGRG